jgi:hypothetical protein
VRLKIRNTESASLTWSQGLMIPVVISASAKAICCSQSLFRISLGH